jgi:hypothetical protein
MNADNPGGKVYDRSRKPDGSEATPFTLVWETKSRRASLDGDIVRAALRGPVLVMDAGNCFNPLRLTRDIRRRTLRLQQTLDHIKVARAFTCFQVVTLLEQTQSPEGPIFIMRLLTTFTDEMISIKERLRLLKQVEAHLERLRSVVAVTLMIKNDSLQEEALVDWLSDVQARADEVVFPELHMPPKPAALF